MTVAPGAPATDASASRRFRSGPSPATRRGTPTIALKGSSIGVFGPVLDPVPDGDEALALWDSVYVALQAPYLWEMKRARPRRSNVQFAD